MEKANKGIRDRIAKHGLKQWEVAEAVGIYDCTFCKWLRTELSPERRTLVENAIDRLTGVQK